jgi:hypothetical protein
METEFHPPGAHPSKSMLSPKPVAAWDHGIKHLLSKIERKLPNVAAAGQDLQALRNLFDLQLLDARALRSRFLLTYLHRERPIHPTG